jgi:type I restriction enzyme M protein
MGKSFSSVLVPELLRASGNIPELILRASPIVEQLQSTLQSTAEFAAWFDIALDVATESGPLSGEIVTPRPLAKLMVELGDIFPGMRVLDPSCGQGTLLSVVHETYPSATLYGEEKDAVAQSLASVRLALYGVRAHLWAGDSLHDPEFVKSPDGKFDCVLCDPPLGIPFFEPSEPLFWSEFGGLGLRRSESMFVALAASLLSPGGRAVVLVPLGFLSRRGVDEELRTLLIQRQLVEGTIKLPQGVVTWTSMPLALLVLQRPERPAHSRLVTLVDSSHLKLRGRRPGGRLLDEHVQEILAKFRGKGGPDTIRLGSEDLSEHASLDPRKYLPYAEPGFDVEESLVLISQLDEQADAAKKQMDDAIERLHRDG